MRLRSSAIARSACLNGTCDGKRCFCSGCAALNGRRFVQAFVDPGMLDGSGHEEGEDDDHDADDDGDGSDQDDVCDSEEENARGDARDAELRQ